MSEVEESCRGSPLIHERRPSFCGSPRSVAGTSHGPSGLKVSAHLPLDHWPPDCSICQDRSDTSLPIVYPAT